MLTYADVCGRMLTPTGSFLLTTLSSTNARLFEEGGEPKLLANGSLTFRLRPLQVGVSKLLVYEALS